MRRTLTVMGLVLGAAGAARAQSPELRAELEALRAELAARVAGLPEEGVAAEPDSDVGTWWMGLCRAAWRADRAEVLRLADRPLRRLHPRRT